MEPKTPLTTMTSPSKPEEPTTLATDLVLELMRAHPRVTQPTSGLKYISRSTGIATDRMEENLITICALIYTEGRRKGFEEAGKMLAASNVAQQAPMPGLPKSLIVLPNPVTLAKITPPPAAPTTTPPKEKP